ncbi:MFS transporter [Advenella sp. FME57]|uniref:MFS transporter n=1 Tax=Advenella sp. FME57 TaxID=2742604 RepID=UPI001868A468|nr:MFS transporter [Advenella sp. FME57]
MNSAAPSQPAQADAAKPAKLKLTSTERRASTTLALLFAVRMLGLFLLTPVFADAAKSLTGGSNAALVGAAIGAYGLTQAILQIPLGMASDRFGRRPVIIGGMVLFIIGGIVCALSDSVTGVVIGRSIQGLGAISAAITAWVADATRPEVRTRAMAMVGGSIGISFALALVLAPLLVEYGGLSGLFWVISLLGFVSLLLATFIVPVAPLQIPAIQSRPRDVLKNGDLLRLNFGVFCLHCILMSIFVVAPPLLIGLGGFTTGTLWKVYLPVILASFVAMVPVVFYTETRHVHKQSLEWSVAGLAIVMAIMAFSTHSFAAIVVLFVGYFVAFNILEALQPSLVSRVAPAEHKGLALGFYNMSQALGVAAGGAVGGLLARYTGVPNVFLMGAILAAVWFFTARSFKSPT